MSEMQIEFLSCFLWKQPKEWWNKHKEKLEWTSFQATLENGKYPSEYGEEISLIRDAKELKNYTTTCMQS